MTISATTHELKEFFLSECHDENLATRLVDRFLHTFGGDNFYVPKKMQNTHKRDVEIRALFNGFNHFELAQAYNLTTRRIRVILANKQ